ncbi:hypothetical protein BD324DRAFT_631804 [Kockovaella imperatae]|uniref:3-oxo-5-alpha-steroid 4-dehydrogenase C-terminal domain-containing protein n=1 Tax=Kockovaella imperatae TaxID=4999 RepID=A0A1Y1UCN9_9TREE|nr:hypothetical protein BD324DRAFT_631804 [Kockovaella imperatae]ORX35811.1 hypothetical protein BD324DRAFT_631804 [Kockovaella imperatae]
MGAYFSAVSSIPAPPVKFFSLLGLYHLLPIHFPLTLWGIDAPFGRFARQDGQGSKLLWMNGNIAWAAMEIVAPLTMLYNILKSPRALSAKSFIIAGCYITHYIHRAIISPLILSPSRSPSNIIVPITAGSYNLLNAYCLYTALAYYPTNRSGKAFYGLLSGWAIGLILNIVHDEILNDLRRPKHARRFGGQYLSEEEKDKKASGGRYAIPRAGLYSLVSHPNYLAEWFEWICFACASAPSLFISVPDHKIPFVSDYWQPQQLLHPSWMFVAFLIASMLPRAIRTQRWYEKTFGVRFPKGRKVIIPFIL